MPHLALEWDQEANGNLTPYMIGPGYNGKVGWKDQLGHQYDAYVTNRALQGTGCRFFWPATTTWTRLIPNSQQCGTTKPTTDFGRPPCRQATSRQ